MERTTEDDYEWSMRGYKYNTWNKEYPPRCPKCNEVNSNKHNKCRCGKK